MSVAGGSAEVDHISPTMLLRAITGIFDHETGSVAHVGQAPKFTSGGEWIDLQIRPPTPLVPMTMKVVVMNTAERHSKLITYLATERCCLRELNVVRIAR